MAASAILYLSRRSQRWIAAFICLALAHVLMASCTPEPVTPMTVRVAVHS